MTLIYVSLCQKLSPLKRMEKALDMAFYGSTLRKAEREDIYSMKCNWLIQRAQGSRQPGSHIIQLHRHLSITCILRQQQQEQGSIPLSRRPLSSKALHNTSRLCLSFPIPFETGPPYRNLPDRLTPRRILPMKRPYPKCDHGRRTDSPHGSKSGRP